jgi:hypothetical protein
MRLFLYLAIFVGFFVLSQPLFAADLSGQKKITLYPREGDGIVIGQVTFSKESGRDAYRYVIDFDESLFSNEFLSMRPFKCLKGPTSWACRQPYPYDNVAIIEGGDLTSLEYDLLFIHKSKGEFGINAWNGLYYRLESQGDGIKGTLMDVDLNILAGTPEEGVVRPIQRSDLEEAPSTRWLRRLEIR